MAYVEESTYGVTPATPEFQELRFQSETLNYNTQHQRANEIRSNRTASPSVRTGADAGGDISFALSYGTFDDFLEALFYSTWESNVLVNGSTRKSFTIEKTFAADDGDQYHRFPGSYVNSFNLSIPTKDFVSGSFGIMSKEMTSAQAAITGATYNAANTNPVFDTSQKFADLAMTGISDPAMVSLDISITNNAYERPVLGSLSSRGRGLGDFEVSGNGVAYFENEEMMDLWLSDTKTDLSFKLGGASEMNYVFSIPRITITNNPTSTPGPNQDVRMEFTFEADYDEGEDAVMEIVRTPAA